MPGRPSAYRIGRPYGCTPIAPSRCMSRAVNRPTSSCNPPMVRCSASFSVESESTFCCSSVSHAFFRCRHFSAASEYQRRASLYPKRLHSPCLLRSRKFLRFSSSVSGLPER